MIGEEFLVIFTVVNVGLTIINTYWAWKRTCYNRDTLLGSKDYWTSWEKRKMDVALQVMKQMGIDSPEEFERLLKQLKKEENKRSKKK